MTLIADSGSTKTAWCLTDGKGTAEYVSTAGINPFYMDEESIMAELQSLRTKIRQPIARIYFYGAGVASPEKAAMMTQCFAHVFPAAVTEAHTDLLGAARALCGNTSGIVGILGTGSNSCCYNGTHIADAVPSCGFILGDEGSGAALGKQLVADLLKRRLPQDLQQAFREQTPLTKDGILEQVYRKPFPNRFLASFTTFLHQHQTHAYVQEMLQQSFDKFFTHNIMHYDYGHYPLHLLGSVAFYFQDTLRTTAAARHITLGKIEKTALPGLLIYHNKYS
jgi:N-acetylglucosamine kinase-like BadF-type ATPase